MSTDRAVSTPPASGHSAPDGVFRIAPPALSRSGADRSEDLRDAARILEHWPAARVMVMDPAGRVELDPDELRLHTVPAADVAAAPPPDAVLLGAVGGRDTWVVPGAVASGQVLREVGALLSDTDAGLLTTATAVLGWHAAARFCGRCGLPSHAATAGWSRVCPHGHEDFPRTDPAVIVLVHDGAERMVLARQPIWPPGRMSVLAGFVEAGESLEATVVREIGEEIGVRVHEVAYLGSQPWPFPRSLMLGFAARADAGAPLFPRDGEIEEAIWIDRDTVRGLLDAGAGGWESAPPGSIGLPPPVSIAHRMIAGWAGR